MRECVCVCQSFGVLMNFSALVRFLFVSFECRFVSSFNRYQRARNDAIPWAEGSKHKRWKREGREAGEFSHQSGAKLNLGVRCQSVFAWVCVCARIINWLLIFI